MIRRLRRVKIVSSSNPVSNSPHHHTSEPGTHMMRMIRFIRYTCASTCRASSDFGDWSSGGGSSSEEGGGNDEWDSYDEDDDLFDEDESGYPAVGTDAGRRARQPSSDDLGYDTGSYDDYSQGEQEDDGFWSSEGGNEHSWEDNDDDDDVLASPKGRNNRAPSRRQPRPSAWTVDGAGSSGRRRSGARGSSRYQRGRRAAAPTTRGFAVRMPAVSGAAIASALRQKMGTAAEAVGQAGSLAASTSQKLKREVSVRRPRVGVCIGGGRCLRSVLLLCWHVVFSFRVSGWRSRLTGGPPPVVNVVRARQEQAERIRYVVRARSGDRNIRCPCSWCTRKKLSSNFFLGQDSWSTRFV